MDNKLVEAMKLLEESAAPFDKATMLLREVNDAGTCSTCHHWGRKFNWLDEDDAFDPTEQFPSLADGKSCALFVEQSGKGCQIASFETIGTGPDFGCIYHKGKVDEQMDNADVGEVL